MAKTQRKFRTALQVAAFPPAPAGKSYDAADLEQRGLLLRVGATRKGDDPRAPARWPRTWILVDRFPGQPTKATAKARNPGKKQNPVRVKLGEYPGMTVEAARIKAAAWRQMIREGRDPREDERRQRAGNLTKQAHTFDQLAEDYIGRKLAGKRKAREMERDIRTELIGPLGKRPTAEITRRDLQAIVEAVAARSRYGKDAHARNILQLARAIFKWGAGQGRYGITESPIAKLMPGEILAPKKARQRTLSDDEMRTLWQATETIGYPYGPFYRLLALTGARKSELSDAVWSDFDSRLVELLRSDKPVDWRRVPDDVKVMTLSPERFKSDRAHVIPLSNAACEILATLPVFTSGNHLFSTDDGVRSIDGFGAAKRRLDAVMGDPAPFVNHDIRRTVRTNLSRLGVQTEVAELCIGHALKGLHAVYDVHDRLDERRDAFERWAAALGRVVRGEPFKRPVQPARRHWRPIKARRVTRPAGTVLRLVQP